MKAIINILCSCILTSALFSQEDTAAVVHSYKYHPIVYTDFGFNASPFSIRHRFTDEVNHLKYRHNFRLMMGFGFSYRWFNLRISTAVVPNTRPVSRFGRARYSGLGLNFTLKNTYNEIDINRYDGYAVKNAYRFIDTLNELKPNLLNPNLVAWNVLFRTSIFFDKRISMSAFTGRTAVYTRDVSSFFMAPQMEFFAVTNAPNPIIPAELADSTNDKTQAQYFSSFGLAPLPGYIYVRKKNNWQWGILGMLGPVLQFKYFNLGGENTRTFAGLVPRSEVRFNVGYNTDRMFFTLDSNFEYKFARFTDLTYNQFQYYVRLSTGYRFKEKPKKKKK